MRRCGAGRPGAVSLPPLCQIGHLSLWPREAASHCCCFQDDVAVCQSRFFPTRHPTLFLSTTVCIPLLHSPKHRNFRGPRAQHTAQPKTNRPRGPASFERADRSMRSSQRAPATTPPKQWRWPRRCGAGRPGALICFQSECKDLTTIGCKLLSAPRDTGGGWQGSCLYCHGCHRSQTVAT